jgi:hypothetical protein
MRATWRIGWWASLLLILPVLVAAPPAPSSIALRPVPRPDFRVRVHTDRSVYEVGDPVQVRFRASEDCRIYIFNTDSEGVTRQIFPNYYDRNNTVRADKPYTIPFGRYLLVATGPAGTESLRLVAYRRSWKALDPWERFPTDDPFPRREVQPDSMRNRVEAEARGQGDAPSGPQEKERRGVSIFPIPPERWDGYAEDSATFRVRSHAEEPDGWGEWSRPELRD